MDTLLSHPRIAAARAHLERTDQVTLERQAALAAVPAPTGAEGLRATRVAEVCSQIGRASVNIDAAGNVLGWWGMGNGERGMGAVVLAAHLDTVFGPEVDVAVQRRGARLEGPGISDNARGLAALVALAEACVRGRVETQRPLLFAATVGGVRRRQSGCRRGLGRDSDRRATYAPRTTHDGCRRATRRRHGAQLDSARSVARSRPAQRGPARAGGVGRARARGPVARQGRGEPPPHPGHATAAARDPAVS